MVYMKNWNEFSLQSKRLFLRSPERTRYSFKYRCNRTKLVLTVTDCTKTLKFQTDQRADLRKMELLTEWMLEAMSFLGSTKELQKEYSSLLEEEAN
mmetsp:Transcript_6307/g.19047  ORF Transcript_6307/g.19047 Transcript_6307/m.19047 type:complete len:96 (+) Transcript_6307:169-456(+)